MIGNKESVTMESNDRSLESLPNIGKVTALQLEKIGIKTKEDFLARDPYEVFNELLCKIDPTLCRSSLAGIVGAKENVPWNVVSKKATEEFERRYPKHSWGQNDYMG